MGLKPHRTLWTTSARPSESVIQYQLLNGCPAVVVPVKLGAPLVAWDSLTLEELWKLQLPTVEKTAGSELEGVVSVLFEYLDLCVDWNRVVLSREQIGSEAADVAKEDDSGDDSDKRMAVRSAVELLVAGAIRSGVSKEVRKEVDKERSGIAMWRIP